MEVLSRSNLQSTKQLRDLNSTFPKQWKITQLKIILKGKDKDKKQLNSYRPISLLPTMSKIFELIILERIKIIYKDSNLANDNQYGFKKGKSTEDAISHLIRSIKDSEKKYVALFIDIQGAFDNLWWPSIKDKLIQSNCSIMLKLASSYFKNRKIIVSSKFENITRKMQRGCPQGFIIGPIASN